MPIAKLLAKLIPVPKSTLRSAIAGEFMTNFGLDDRDQIKNIQQAVKEGLIREVVVIGRNSRHEPKEVFRLNFKKLEQDTQLKLDLNDGKSYLEALDTALAGAVANGVALMRRRGYTPEFRIDWSDEANRDPKRLAEATRRLKLAAAAAPIPELVPDPVVASSWSPSPSFAGSSGSPGRSIPAPGRLSAGPLTLPPNITLKPVLTITPGKDNGITYTHQTARRT